MLQALIEMKTEKAPGSSEISLQLIAASGGVGNQVMAQICHKVLDGFGIPAELALSIVIPILKVTSTTVATIELRSFLSMV